MFVRMMKIVHDERKSWAAWQWVLWMSTTVVMQHLQKHRFQSWNWSKCW